MTDNIVPWGGIARLPEPPNDVLEKAKAWSLERVIVVGANEKGDLIIGGSFGEPEGILWLLECAKHKLMTELT